MILRVLIIFFLLFSTGLLYAQEGSALFENANAAYSNGDYDKALEMYLQILDNGLESGEIYYNLGNTYYKLDEIGLAILYYEKAKILIPGDAALEQNLNIARLKIVDKIEPIPRLFIEEWWQFLTHMLPFNFYIWMTFILFSLAMIWIAANILWPARYLSYLYRLFLALFVFSLILTATRIYDFESNRFGIILASKVTVHSQPGAESTEVFVLHEGSKVQINREREQWAEITLADGKTGWLRSGTIADI